MRLWQFVIAVALPAVCLASEGLQEGQLVPFHPITRDEYDAILGLTAGQPIISEARLIASGLAALKGLAAGLTTGLAASWIPSILSTFAGAQAQSSERNITDGYPLCVISSVNLELEQEAQHTRQAQSADEQEENAANTASKDADDNRKKSKVPILNCIVVVKHDEDIEKDASSKTTTTTTTTSTTPRPKPAQPWRAPYPIPYFPGRAGAGNNFPWQTYYPYYPYQVYGGYPGYPGYSENGAYSQGPATRTVNRGSAAVVPWPYPQPVRSKTATRRKTKSKQRQKQRIRKPARASRPATMRRPVQPQASHKSHTKAKRHQMPGHSYSANGYQPAAYPQASYHSEYPQVSYMQTLPHTAPVYRRPSRLYQSTAAARKPQNLDDSEESDNSAELIKVRNN